MTRAIVLTTTLPTTTLEVAITEHVVVCDAVHMCELRVIAVDGTVVARATIPILDDGRKIWFQGGTISLNLIASGEVDRYEIDPPCGGAPGRDSIAGAGYAHVGCKINLTFKTPHRILEYDRHYRTGSWVAK